jgi:hypothetical protein
MGDDKYRWGVTIATQEPTGSGYRNETLRRTRYSARGTNKETTVGIKGMTV